MPRRPASRPLSYKTPASKRLWQRRFRWPPWSKETLGLTLSLLVLIIIAIILARFNGRQFTDWHSSITLNALISVLISIFYVLVVIPIASCVSQLKWTLYTTDQVSLEDFQIYDAASRSIFGSAALIIKRPKRILALLAAVLTITVTAVGPFVQQILSLEYHNIDIGPASIPILTDLVCTAENFDCFNNTFSVFASGLSNRQKTTYQPTFNCGSSVNCTWPSYSTMVLSSRCIDVTSLIKVDTACPLVEDGKYYDCSKRTGNQTSTKVTLSLPNGLSVSASYWGNTNTQTDISLDKPLSTLNESGLVFLGATVLHLSGNTSTRLPVSGGDNFFASECVIQFAGQRKTADLIYKAFNETDVGLPFFDNSPSAQALSVWGRDRSGPDNPMPTLQIPGSSTAFRFDMRSAYSILLSILTYSGPAREDLAAAITNQPNHDTVVTAMTNAAASLTQWLRENTALSGGAVASGSATQDVVVYDITWGWITLPAILILLTFVLMVFTAIASREAGLEMWADSVLPVLYNGPHQDSSAHGYVRLADMEDAARRDQAQFNSERHVLVVGALQGDGDAEDGLHADASRVALTAGDLRPGQMQSPHFVQQSNLSSHVELTPFSEARLDTEQDPISHRGTW